MTELINLTNSPGIEMIKVSIHQKHILTCWWCWRRWRYMQCTWRKSVTSQLVTRCNKGAIVNCSVCVQCIPPNVGTKGTEREKEKERRKFYELGRHTWTFQFVYDLPRAQNIRWKIPLHFPLSILSSCCVNCTWAFRLIFVYNLLHYFPIYYCSVFFFFVLVN